MSYEYSVDDYNGNKHSKKETIDGDTAVGEYRTLLPDGKTQIVTYQSGPNGHLANVAYEGGAADASAYAAAPSYSSMTPDYASTTTMTPISTTEYVTPAPVTYAPETTYAPAPASTYAPAPAPTYAPAPAPTYAPAPAPTYTAPVAPAYKGPASYAAAPAYKMGSVYG